MERLRRRGGLHHLGRFPGSAQLGRRVHAPWQRHLPAHRDGRSGPQRLGPHGHQRHRHRRAHLVLHLGVRRHRLLRCLQHGLVAVRGPRGWPGRPLPGGRGGPRGLGRLQLLPGCLRRGLGSPRPRAAPPFLRRRGGPGGVPELALHRDLYLRHPHPARRLVRWRLQLHHLRRSLRRLRPQRRHRGGVLPADRRLRHRPRGL